jgi:beta-1,4-glucosyltransferase
MIGNVMKQKNSTESALDWLSRLDAQGYETMLERITRTDKPVVVGFLNQHAYNLIEQRPAIKENFRAIDYLLRDGIGIKMACKANGLVPGLNLNGTDFIPALVTRLRQGASQPQFFAFGTQQPWLSNGAAALTGASDVVVLDGFREPKAYVELFQATCAGTGLAVIVLAMGMPKQEEVAQKLKAAITGPAIIVCGGAILDFASGRVERAPALMRRTGTEWLYRLCKEPARLFQRYVIGIPLFFVYVLRNLMKQARHQASSGTRDSHATPASEPDVLSREQADAGLRLLHNTETVEAQTQVGNKLGSTKDARRRA